MASATGMPAQPPRDADISTNEQEPLLGRPGDATQKPEASMISNLTLGTGWIAQAGVALLVALVWAGVFLHPLLPLVSPHPLLQSAGVFAVTQAILVLQPTWTADAKASGQRAHATLNVIAFLLFIAGVAVIETNKFKSGAPHFHSVHGYLGVAAAAVLAAQYFFGVAMWATPWVFGGENRAKRYWKLHRWSGYVVYPLLLATVLSATQTDYNWNVLDIKIGSVAVAVALIVVGVYPRVSLTKLGFNRPRANSS